MVRGKFFLLKMACSAVLAVAGCSRQDAAVHQLKQEMSQAFQQDLKPEERRKMMDQFRERVESLPEEQRREVRQAAFQNFRRREAKRLNEYILADAKSKQKMLDDDIQEMEKRRKEREKRQKEREKNGAQAGSPEGGPPGGPGGPPGGPGGGFGGPGGMAGGLARTSPDERAARAVYMEDMAKRRQQLGLPPMPSRR